MEKTKVEFNPDCMQMRDVKRCAQAITVLLDREELCDKQIHLGHMTPKSKDAEMLRTMKTMIIDLFERA